MSEGPIYALNLFDIQDSDEYRIYAQRSLLAVRKYRGHVLALGKFHSAHAGDIPPRSVMILVEWESLESFQAFLADPGLTGLHPHRENGVANHVWHLFDKLADLRPVLEQHTDTTSA